jgi:hypothetical protein
MIFLVVGPLRVDGASSVSAARRSSRGAEYRGTALTMQSVAGRAKEGPRARVGPLPRPGRPVWGVGRWDQWPKVNQLTFTKSDGWPLVKVR